MISIALAIWGMILPWVITFDQADTQPAGLGDGYVLAYAQTTIYPGQPHPVACNITYITPHIQNLTTHELQNVTTHEVGHCLGLGHISHPGIMSPTLGYEFSEWDRLEFWHHYRSPYGARVLFVATD